MPISADNLRRLSGWLDVAGQLLDSLFGIAGRVGILLAVGIVIYAVVQLFFSADEPSQTRSGKLLVLLNGNWKAALLVMLPVFYLPLRAFISRIRQVTAAGVSATFADTGEQPYRESLPEQDSRR